MDTASLLKKIQQAASSHSVFSEDYIVQTTKDDPDGERFTIVIQIPKRNDSGQFRTFELGGFHASATPQQLDHVITGAVLASKKFDAEEKEFECTLPFDSLTREEQVQHIVQECEAILRRNPGFKEYSYTVRNVSNMKQWIESDEERVILKQPPSLKQWHPNVCGYHALYNAYVALYELDVADHHASRVTEEVDFWAFVFRALQKLKEHRNRTGLWSSARLERGTLDENHLDFLIKHDPLLTGHVSIVAYPDGLPMLLSHCVLLKRRHSFLLACSSHWIGAAIIGEKEFITMDSHNKPLPSITSQEMSFALASKTIDEYRSTFCAKMKEVSRYQHYPDEVLSRLYEDGIPEYWKGTVKDKMWWLHRPARVRVEILFRELETAREYLDKVLKILSQGASEMPKLKPQGILPRPASKRPFQASPGVFTNLTSEDSSLAGYLRRDEELAPGDEGYDPTAPPTIYNRKRPPPPEIKGDAFDRQRVIPGFDQATIERQACLVVGTGGIGMNVALSLARLGVGSICLVDYDIYDASNLTRQCLGTRFDVGLKKTDVALKNIQAHNLRTEVTSLEADIIKDWHKVVAAAKTCSVIFNCCDAGLMFDFALNSLSKELRVPLCCGQSFGWKYMSEFYSGEPEFNCAFCSESTLTTFSCHNTKPIWERLMSRPNMQELCNGDIGSYIDALDEFFSADEAFRLVRGSLKEMLIAHPESAVSRTSLPMDADQFHKFVIALHDSVVAMMLPGQISRQTHLGFAARPRTPSTRYVGSWVCPCLACGVTCVSHWSLYLTGPDPKKRNPPTCILFNMDEGMTADEQMAYECGLILNRADRSFATSPSSTSCVVCTQAQRLKEEQDLFFGSQVVFLRPAAGGGEQVGLTPAWNEEITSEAYEEGKRRILEGVQRQKVTGDATERILIPVVPAIDPVASEVSGDTPVSANGIWPSTDLGIVPLVKTSKEDALEWPGSIRGVSSGVRSAVVPVMRHNKCYRLKGCGNHDQAFPLEVKGDDGVSFSLRGCMFEGTAARELFMSEYVDVRCDVVCGNRPLGFYRYPTEMPRTINTAWRWEAAGHIEKFCGVFETCGEKRLGDDLLTGMEVLLGKVAMVTNNRDEDKQMALHFLRSQGRFTGEELLDSATQVECGGNVVDCSLLPLKEDFSNLLPMALSKYSTLWTSALSHLQQMEASTNDKQNPQTPLILAVAYRLGWECGITLARLASGGVSWGTYPDEMGIHCNAHANNFVVNAFSDNEELVAAVDFDMAFTRETFVPGCWKGKDTFFPKDFDGILQFEQTMGLQISLAGSDFSSTGCTNAAATISSDSETSKLLRVLLRDTVVAGYQAGLSKEKPSHMLSSRADLAHARHIIVLALIASDLKI